MADAALVVTIFEIAGLGQDLHESRSSYPPYSNCAAFFLVTSYLLAPPLSVYMSYVG